MATSLSPFPFAHHGSLLGVQTVLLGFVALYLPRSTFLLTEIPEQTSSKDRPQHSFLKPLTADPVLTLGWLCLGAIIVQAWWAENLRSLWKERDITRTAAGGDELRVKSSLTEGRQRWKSIKGAFVSTLVASFAFHCVIILFGAPVLEHFSKTYLLGLLLALLTVYPAVYTLDAPSLAEDSRSFAHRLEWIRMFAELNHRNAFERCAVFPSLGTVIGAWLGAIPIALDWDRPWQAWPLTPAYGAFVGNILASWAAFLMDVVFMLAETDKSAGNEVKTAAEGQVKNSKRRKKAKDDVSTSSAK